MEHMLDKDVERVLFSEEELHRRVAEIAAEIEAITDTIKREMTAQGVDMLAGDDWKATWKQVQSARFDSRAFKVAMPDLYERFTRSAETRRFVLA